MSDTKKIFSTLCRLCLNHNVELIGLYPAGEFNGKVSSSRIFEIIERFTTVNISPWDRLPQKICMNCVETIKSMLAFQNTCKQNDIKLNKMIETTEETGKLNECQSLGEPVDNSNNLNESGLVAKSMNRDDSLNIDESTTTDEMKDMTAIHDDSKETKKIVEVNVNDLEFGSDDKSENIENSTKHDPIHLNAVCPRWKALLIACHICGKRYCKYEMQYHINKHNGLRPFKCDIENCTSTFYAPRDLNIHKKALHFGEPGFSCDICGKAFKWNQGLNIHRRRHFDPEIPCKICGKLFKTNPSLKKHLLVHSQDRKFNCETCGKAFQTRYTLRIHNRVHTQEKPYSCHCGLSFAYKCLLTAHNKRYH